MLAQCGSMTYRLYGKLNYDAKQKQWQFVILDSILSMKGRGTEKTGTMLNLNI